MTAADDGSWSAQVDALFGSDVITASATTSAGATGVARVDVVGDLVGGTTILDVTDPSGDDNGPGTYQYPTAADFVAGSFDITRFQVLQQGDTVYLRTTLRNLVATFGNPDGAQLLDVYVHQPGASPTSTDGGVREPQLLDRTRRRLEPADRGAGLRRPGLAGRERRPGRHRQRRRRVPGGEDDHHRRCPAAELGTPGLGLVVQRRAHRSGRLLRRLRAHLRRDAAAVPVRGLRRRRPVPDLRRRPGLRCRRRSTSSPRTASPRPPSSTRRRTRRCCTACRSPSRSGSGGRC